MIRYITDFRKKIDNLPLTKIYLLGIIESVQDFHIRKCKKAIQQMILDNQEITMNKFRKNVKMRDKRYFQIEKEVMLYLKELGF